MLYFTINNDLALVTDWKNYYKDISYIVLRPVETRMIYLSMSLLSMKACKNLGLSTALTIGK